MTTARQAIADQLRLYVQQMGFALDGGKAIDYGQQFRISNGLHTCIVNIFDTGKVTFGGKASELKVQMETWHRSMQAAKQGIAPSTEADALAARSTKYVVAASKFDKIRAVIEVVAPEATWQEAKPENAQVYRGELRSGSDRVVVTQYQTGTLLVQGRATHLFDEVCRMLDANLVATAADRATRYIPEEQSKAALAEMSRPEAESQAWDWLCEQLGQPILQFMDKHDVDTLVSGAMLLQAARGLDLRMPDYSPLVMPFARAYEGFLIKFFIHIGSADAEKVKQDVRSIQVGSWLRSLPKRIVDLRHHHISTDLLTAWEGTRHLMLHSDPVRQLSIPSLGKADDEICGVIMRAIGRAYHNFIAQPIAIRPLEEQTTPTNTVPADGQTASSKEPNSKPDEALRVEGVDENALLNRLAAANYQIEQYRKPNTKDKWLAKSETEQWQIFYPRDPSHPLIVRGKGGSKFIEWYNTGSEVLNKEVTGAAGFKPHIGADEAGKGDYYGPLVVAAVYVDKDTAQMLLNAGVRDSKSVSDSKIQELALTVRNLCPNVVIALKPPEYNDEYEQVNNLNTLLAQLHAKAITRLSKQIGCRQVLVDQFADSRVMEQALADMDSTIELEQRTQAESDIAVAAASILAREHFLATIEDYRAKAGLDIPLGGSSPELITVGQTIVRKWGDKALRRIAKMHFKTTQKIIS